MLHERVFHFIGARSKSNNSPARTLVAVKFSKFSKSRARSFDFWRLNANSKCAFQQDVSAQRFSSHHRPINATQIVIFNRFHNAAPTICSSCSNSISRKARPAGGAQSGKCVRTDGRKEQTEKREALPLRRAVSDLSFLRLNQSASEEGGGGEGGGNHLPTRGETIYLSAVFHESSCLAERRRPADWLVWETSGANPKKCDDQGHVTAESVIADQLKSKQFLQIRPSWLYERGRDRRTHLDSHLIWIFPAWI